ncbi:MAG: hypothetical protein LBC03_02055 [Nitrososphaerota archaeon]|jgi:uncharacterized Zn finger protein (UPF0148 family)|nr:hypothetical protein [Nitrososphaerota archaeon]
MSTIFDSVDEEFVEIDCCECDHVSTVRVEKDGSLVCPVCHFRYDIADFIEDVEDC